MSELDTTQASIIATMVLFPEKIEEVEALTCEEWFTGDYRLAFHYMVKHGGGDPAALSAAIEVSMATICEWTDLEFSAAYLPQHVANLERESSMRSVQYLGRQLLKVTETKEAMSLVERFTSSFSAKDKSDPVGIKKGCSLLYRELERRHANRGKLLGMTTGLSGLDLVTDGFHRGDLVVIAGSSSMGKTAMAVGAAEAVAKAGDKVLIFSCEMTIEQLLMRSLAGQSNIPLGVVRAAAFQGHQWSKVSDAIGEMSNWPVLIDDVGGIGIQELTRKVRKVKKSGLDMVLIDYLQIMGYDKDRETKELDIITTALKNLAKELNVCVVLLSQLSRGSEKEKRKPVMSDLRGSGMIENNADVILFPYREAANCQLCQDKVENGEHSTKAHQVKAEVIIGKQRQGERNISVKLAWIGERTRFVGLDTRHDGGYDD